MKLKNYIQDLINKGDIEVDIAKPGNSNDKLKMYQAPFPKHGKYKAPSSNAINYDYTNYVSGFDSFVVHIEPFDNSVNIIIVKGVDPSPTTHKPRVTIQGIPLCNPQVDPPKKK